MEYKGSGRWSPLRIYVRYVCRSIRLSNGKERGLTKIIENDITSQILQRNKNVSLLMEVCLKSLVHP